jgi:RimJ/RimL family protein N-acetyltransferase
MLIKKLWVQDAAALLNYFKDLVTLDTKRVERPEDVAKITIENEVSWIKSRIEDETKGEMFVLCMKDENDQIIAEGEVERKKRWIERHVAEIRFGILPAYTQHAKTLVQQLIDLAKENGIEILFYFHLESQVAGIETMKQLGFKEIGIIENYYKLQNKDYVNRVYLSKNIS